MQAGFCLKHLVFLRGKWEAGIFGNILLGHVALGWNLRTHVRKPGMTPCTCRPSAGEAEVGVSLELSGRPAYLKVGELQVQGETPSPNTKQGVVNGDA